MIVAIDCDLRTSYVVDSGGNAGRGATPWEAITDLPHTGAALCTILFEIASPVSFVRGAGSNQAMYQLAKWAIWNVAQAAALHARYPQLLVAPSNVWTRGHDLKTRHLIARCKQPKKDLRECEAMLFFYQQRPQDWISLGGYLENLRPAPPSA